MLRYRGKAIGGVVEGILVVLPTKETRQARFLKPIHTTSGDEMEWWQREDGKIVFKNLTSGAVAVGVMERPE